MDPAWSIENHVDVKPSRLQAEWKPIKRQTALQSRSPLDGPLYRFAEESPRSDVDLEQDDREPIIATLDLLHIVQQPSE